MQTRTLLVLSTCAVLLITGLVFLRGGNGSVPPGSRPQVVDYGAHNAPPPADLAPQAILGTTLAAVRDGEPVPRRFYRGFPTGLKAIPAGEARKRRFYAVMLPLVLRANEIVNAQRARMIALVDDLDADKPLPEPDRAWLVQTYNRLMPERERVDDVAGIDRTAFKRRLAPVPVSLALTQAATESAWGTSRFARQGNAAFGVWTWNETHDGIVPQERAEGANHRVRAYDYLIDSVLDYILTLNKGGAYAEFRRLRAEQMATGGPLDGHALAGTLINYSERREAYVDELQQMIRGNALEVFDRAALAPPAAATS